ncbi:hypothetical protein MHI24_25955 [Paenibacillus sp. FSL K6-1096]|uniref:hypothetical protein n=1 Tax=Paenibacillus sp. FSL K6-1096 TaxID=2921460 RepID=UPI0030ED14D7
MVIDLFFKKPCRADESSEQAESRPAGFCQGRGRSRRRARPEGMGSAVKIGRRQPVKQPGNRAYAR